MNKTPYYLLDEDKLLSNFESMKRAFEKLWPNFKIAYSYKTNNLPWLVNWMKEHGALAEVVSYPEYKLAQRVGNKISNIVYNGPNKNFEGLDEAVLNGAIVNLDNFSEIEHLLLFSSSKRAKIKVGLRINFDLESYCPNETIPGKEPGRFGFNIENGDLQKAISLLSSIPNVSIVGLHGHHSTRTKSLKIFKTIAEQMCQMANHLSKIEYLDMGGCLFGDKPGAPTFDEYASTIVNVFKHYQIPSKTLLIMEPGAALVASPFSYVCSVLAVKDIQTTRLVFTDGSVKHIAPQMNAVRFMSSVQTTSTKLIARQVVSGYTCIENDRFLELIDCQELQIGDTIQIYNTGAYSLSLSPLFIEYYPKVIVKNGLRHKIVREAWDIDEFMQKNIL